MHRDIRKLAQSAREYFRDNTYKGFPIADIEEVKTIAQEEAGGENNYLIQIGTALEIGFMAGIQYEQNQRKAKEAIGKRLRKARGSKSVEEVCNTIGITEESLLAYEAGKRVPRDSVKLRLSQLYCKPIAELFF